jgi:hypothetical protein
MNTVPLEVIDEIVSYLVDDIVILRQYNSYKALLAINRNFLRIAWKRIRKPLMIAQAAKFADDYTIYECQDDILPENPFFKQPANLLDDIAAFFRDENVFPPSCQYAMYMLDGQYFRFKLKIELLQRFAKNFKMIEMGKYCRMCVRRGSNGRFLMFEKCRRVITSAFTLEILENVVLLDERNLRQEFGMCEYPRAYHILSDTESSLRGRYLIDDMYCDYIKIDLFAEKVMK